jgi:hypothetical protein
MAVVNTKSTQITNADATPPVINNSAIVKGKELVASATVSTVATDNTTSVYRLVRLPSNAVVSSIMLFNGDLDSAASGTWDIGLLQTLANGGTATGADVDLFATAIATFQSENKTGTEVRFETLAITTINQTLWELLGLSADSQREYDLVANLKAEAGLLAAAITVVVRYSVA